jgi:hypothetical protein
MVHKMRKKGAIELSVNFIVIIIISMAVLAGGFVLFNKLRSSAVKYVETVDSQTEAKLKSVMLSNALDVAVYPTDITLKSGQSLPIAIGITNRFDNARCFQVQRIDINPLPSTVSFFPNLNTLGLAPTGWANNVRMPTNILRINPKSQVSRTVLFTMPSAPPGNRGKGTYLVTLSVRFSTNSPANCATATWNAVAYGRTNVYILHN